MKKIANFILAACLLSIFILPAFARSQETWRERLRQRWNQRAGNKQVTKESPSERLASSMEYKQITHGGLQRSYWLYVPRGIEKTNNRCPLVIVLHGGDGSGRYMAVLTRFNRLAQQQGFIVVYPDGIEKHWNDGRGVQEWRCQRENIDDVGFISTLIDHLAAQYPIDLNRVYVTGISNGAMMTHRLAADLSNRIAAAAMVAGNIPENYLAKGVPAVPVPMLVINGTKDLLMPWGGGNIGFKGREKSCAVSTEQTINFWRKYDRCETTGQSVYKPDHDPKDGTRVRVHGYQNNAGKVMVMLYEIEGGGHTWPGTPSYIPQAPKRVPKEASGLTSFDIDATAETYDFFKQYSRDTVSRPRRKLIF